MCGPITVGNNGHNAWSMSMWWISPAFLKDPTEAVVNELLESEGWS